MKLDFAPLAHPLRPLRFKKGITRLISQPFLIQEKFSHLNKVLFVLVSPAHDVSKWKAVWTQ